MPVESAADRLAFLNPDEFGIEGVYQTRAGASATIAGVHNAGTISVGFSGASASTDVSATFVCRSADLPAGAIGEAGDSLTIDGTRYAVADLEPDGLGMTRLILAR